jgi:hypothetical protein
MQQHLLFIWRVIYGQLLVVAGGTSGVEMKKFPLSLSTHFYVSGIFYSFWMISLIYFRNSPFSVCYSIFLSQYFDCTATNYLFNFYQQRIFPYEKNPFSNLFYRFVRFL